MSHGAIVTGTDGSESATAAVRQAAELAGSSGVALHVVSAFPAGDGDPRDAVGAILETAREALGDVDVAIHLHAEPGEPAEAVCAVAARVGAGLIVVGNKGIDAGLRPAIADEVRKRAPCNVLVVDTEAYWHPVTGVEQRRSRIPREWQILLVTTVAVFMAFLDVTIVNVAFPSIAADFPGTSLADLSWVLNAYNIVFAALLVPAGRLADRIGQRRLFFGGLWLFLAGSVLCGIAPDAVLLIAARVVQAIGAAALIPTSLALVLPEFPPERRAVATSVWAAAGAVAAATGPSLGGVLIDAGNWRWAFLVNVVVALGVLPARRLLVDRTDPAGADPPDLLGGAMLAGAVGALALGIVKAPDWGWTDDRVVFAWLAAALALLALALRTKRHPAPVLEPALLRIRSFTIGNAAMLVLSMGFYALLLANVLFLTQVWGYSVLDAGFGVTPGPLAATVAAVAGGRLTERLGPRFVLVPAALVAAGACLLYRAITGDEPAYVSDWLPAQLLSGAAFGFAFAALATATVMDLPPNRLATGTALSSCARQIGAVVGIAVLIAVLGTPAPAEAPAVFDRAWLLMAAALAASGLVALRLPSGRVGEIAGGAPLRHRLRPLDIPGLETREIDLHGHRMVYPLGRRRAGDPARARAAGLVADLAQAGARAGARPHGDRARPARPRRVGRADGGGLLAGRPRRHPARPARRARPPARDGRRALARRRHRDDVRLPLPGARRAARADLQRRARARGQPRAAGGDAAGRGRDDAHGRRAAGRGRRPCDLGAARRGGPAPSGTGHAGGRADARAARRLRSPRRLPQHRARGHRRARSEGLRARPAAPDRGHAGARRLGDARPRDPGRARRAGTCGAAASRRRAARRNRPHAAPVAAGVRRGAARRVGREHHGGIRPG